MGLSRRALVAWSITAGLIALLVVKYFWTFVAYDVPLGYDAGIYRYLFLKHAAGFPPFLVAEMDPWAREHPIGLFFFTTIWLRAGMPVDWLVGWVWNAMPVTLALVLAFAAWRREGSATGILTLLFTLLSVAQFEGFFAMYWKTFAALVFCVLCFHFLERHRLLPAALTGMMTIALHHQTGLLFALSVATWMLVQGIEYRARRDMLAIGAGGALIAMLGLLWYAPVFSDVILGNLRLLRPGGNPGSFPPVLFFLKFSLPLLFLGCVGFARSFARERGTLWQAAVFWSLLLMLVQFTFYRRFMLLLDAFLLPFAARAVVDLWERRAALISRALLLFVVSAQGALTLQALLPAGSFLCAGLPVLCDEPTAPAIVPSVDRSFLNSLASVAAAVPADALLLVPDPFTAPWVRGWVPGLSVAAPGVFGSPWDEAGWTTVLLGDSGDRANLLRALPTHTYLLATSVFERYYGEHARLLLADPCFVPAAAPSLYRIACP